MRRRRDWKLRIKPSLVPDTIPYPDVMAVTVTEDVPSVEFFHNSAP